MSRRIGLFARAVTVVNAQQGSSRSVLRGLVALVLLGLVSGCGPGALQVRQGSLAQCADAAKGKERELLGWISVAPADRWVAAADRMGARSQILAPGSSLRDRVAELMRESAKKTGFANADWFDWARPIHIMLQVAEGEPAKGTVLVIPVSSRDQFEQAAKPILRAGEAGAAASLMPKDTGPKPMQLAWPHPTTLLMAESGERLGRAAELANCAQTKKPEDLLQVGIVLDAMARHHGEKLQSALADLAAESGGPFKTALAPYRELVRRAVEGSKTLEFGLADAGDDIVLDAHLQLRPGSELAASFGRVAALGPSPLVARLPASAWLVSASTSDLTDSARQIDMALSAWRTMLQDQAAALAGIETWMRELYTVVGPYSALAMHTDGEFPLAMTALMSSKDPQRLLSVMRDGSFKVIRDFAMSRPEVQANMAPPLKAALDSGGWTALFQMVAEKLQGTPFTLTTLNQNADGLQCEVLRVDIAPGNLGGGNPWWRARSAWSVPASRRASAPPMIRSSWSLATTRWRWLAPPPGQGAAIPCPTFPGSTTPLARGRPRRCSDCNPLCSSPSAARCCRPCPRGPSRPRSRSAAPHRPATRAAAWACRRSPSPMSREPCAL